MTREPFGGDPGKRSADETASWLLRCEQLTVGYGGRAILPPIDITVRSGTLYAVVGRNGAGKTTWFRTLLGLLPPVRGRIEHAASLRIGYVPQRVQLMRLQPFLSYDVVSIGLERGRSFLRPWLSREQRRRIAQALEQMNAAALAKQRFGELSEGQKQQVLMARLLVSRPQFAVLDEPMAGMDYVAEQKTGELVGSLCHEHGIAVLIVSHNLAFVAAAADEAIFVDRASQTVVQGPPSTVMHHPVFQRTYAGVNGNAVPFHA